MSIQEFLDENCFSIHESTVTGVIRRYKNPTNIGWESIKKELKDGETKFSYVTPLKDNIVFTLPDLYVYVNGKQVIFRDNG